MMSDWFWDFATSLPMLGVDALILIAAVVVGYFPLMKYVPAVVPYVAAARLVALLVAALMFFLIGFRVSDEREEVKSLRATVATQKADLRNAEKSAKDADARAAEIEKDANAGRKQDDDYIARLKSNPDCGFEPFPGRVRDRSSGNAGNAGARSAAGAGKDHEGPPGAGARSRVSLPLVWDRWLPWKRP